MSNIYRFFFAMLLVGFVAVTVPANAQEGDYDVEFELALDNASQFVWRGVVVNDEQVLQPSVTASMGGFSLNVWANYNVTNNSTPRGENINWVDYTLAYSGETDQFTYSLGAIYRDFPGTGVETGEVFGSIGFDVMLNPELTVYYDVDEVEGFYSVLAIGHSIPLNADETFALDMGASVGYADNDFAQAYYASTDGGFADLVASVGLSYAITDSLGVGVSVSFSELLDSDIEAGADAVIGDSDALWTTFSISYSF